MLGGTLRRFLCFGAVLCAVFPAAPVSGQDAAPEEPRRTLISLQDSARLRLFAPGVYVEDGLFLGFENDSVQVSDADALLRVGVGEIEALAVRRSKWRSVALQSAGVGVVAGGLAGFVMGTKGCGAVFEGCDGHAAGVSIRWAALFGGLGGVLGAIMGSRIESWESVFP